VSVAPPTSPVPTAAAPPTDAACPLCGAALDPTQEWCLRCGAAARTRLAASPSWKWPVIALAVVVALSLGVLAAALVTLAGGSGHSKTAPTTVIVTTTPAVTTPTATVSPTTTAVPDTSTPTNGLSTPTTTSGAAKGASTAPASTTPAGASTGTSTAPGLTTPTTATAVPPATRTAPTAPSSAKKTPKQ
jgi:hypothetical protein